MGSSRLICSFIGRHNSFRDVARTYLEKMEKMEAEVPQMIQERKQKIKEFKDTVELSNKDAETEIADGRNWTKLCSVVSLASQAAASSIDVPLRGAAVQSSTFPGRSAGRAVDGSCNPDGHLSCTHTDTTDNPWWRLQLDGVHRVSVIEITNRNIARDRLDGVEIHIGNSLVNNGNDNPRCAIVHDVSDGLTQTVHCWGMEGMYVNFYKPSKGPAEQEIVDRLVARAPFPLTSHLWVGLRRSILGSSWFWMSGDPMDFTQWDEAPQEPSPCGAVPSTERPTGGKKVRFFSTTRVKPTCKN
ncbi:unnamed protein product [Boreogadus saida]